MLKQIFVFLFIKHRKHIRKKHYRGQLNGNIEKIVLVLEREREKNRERTRQKEK